ncbi:hypothetical protein [Dictyobacter arantiisoli]|uniref:Uncharacterized protein n=1 Tax=Dictyobacter arantiisoli TaxID=2014874 RepID=A0A5A5TDJ2_9CHLR|nr:hypothetical protein [Dictyobacter arantiisoli]GCF09611.1 hypothetical protein KDI_31750 [Dictyobacter arantiisoli]
MSEFSPEEQAFLDEAYQRLRTTRTTFTDKEALQPAFDEGYDLDMLHDPRFARAELKQGDIPPHYRLAEHILANTRLLNELQAGTWDGNNLTTKLAELDTEIEPAQDGERQQHHIFYPHDPRIFQNRQGAWEAHGERQITVPLDLTTTLDTLLAGLKKRWLQINTPLTINRIIELLRDQGWKQSERPNAARYIRAWLLSTSQFQRVNQDYWIPLELLPPEIQHTRLQVQPLRTPDQPQEPEQAGNITDPTGEQSTPTSQRPSYAETLIVKGTATKSHVSWTTYLRTSNLNEGFLAVPKAMQVIYPPQFPGESTQAVIRGRWYTDNTMLWIWLDRVQHRLYGPDLLDKFFDQDTGDKLRIEWQADEITLHLAGHSDEIQQEETRLIDIEELKQLRLGIGENYRQTIQAILAAAPQGLLFRELVRIVSERQQHPVSSRSIRALLAAGTFLHHQGRWYAAPNDKDSARALRATLIETLVPPEQSTHATHSEYVHTRVNAIYQRLTEITQLLRDSV